MSRRSKYRIAHFSDFHIKRRGRDFDGALALIIDAIERNADHVIITGDLVESGEMKVVKAFLQELELIGWGCASKLTIIPGNHDIFPISKRKFSPLRRPTAIFEEFVEITASTRTGPGCRRLRRGEPFPSGKVLADGIVLAGLDTTRNGRFDPRHWAEGELPDSHREAVSRYFSKHGHFALRIVAMHHHPTEELVWGDELIPQNFAEPSPKQVHAWLKESGASVVLCGHIHAKSGIKRQNLGKSGVILRSGTAGGVDDEDRDDRSKLRIYHLLDLYEDGRRRITQREVREDLGKFLN